MTRNLITGGAVLVVLAIAGCGADRDRNASATLSVIPAPADVRAHEGAFSLSDVTPVVFDQNPQLERIAGHFTDLVARTTDIRLNTLSPNKVGVDQRVIRLELDASEGTAGEEGYALDVSPQRIVVSARSPRGLFYGVITLWQLITANLSAESAANIPAVTVTDRPRFAWRGLMLDVARHHMPPEFVKQMIDWMAVHKLNTLHWHLTDDQGWRLEIRKYPLLTEVGAWRVPPGAAGLDAATGKPRRYGGYYNQDEVRDIVRYAAERFITVVPEIEMPGHAQAAIAAYPQLGTLNDRPRVSPDWGIHAHLFNVEEDTFTFLENVLTEVLELFPSPYIHVGGDEAVKDQWQASGRVQRRMRELGVANEAALQGYFVHRIDAFLRVNGRRLVGWDEILEGGLPPDAIVMSWRGMDGGREAARLGHDVVMAPAPDLYFDHVQTDVPNEPSGRPGTESLADVYSFEAVPGDLTPEEARHIIGLQANLWTEHVRTPDRVQHMVFPRLAAVAEISWSPATRRDWNGFMARMPDQLDRYRALGIRYAESAFEVPKPPAEDLRRSDDDLKLCHDKLPLRLEDDAPFEGERAVFMVDILDPCWIYEQAPLDEIKSIEVTIGQLPYNFQLWKDASGIVTRKPATEFGELVVRKDSCSGELLASISLEPALTQPALTTISAPLRLQSGAHDLCFMFTGKSHDPMWAIDTVQLRK